MLEGAETLGLETETLRGPVVSVYGIFDVAARTATNDEISGGGCNFIKRQWSGCQ